MASLIPDYEYDIFISYRQKDNKYDGWVTEFVDNLKKELEATFKEEISVYFDINPHDGLLETHDVDASLKEKLKCLVFIPIISRTYCDPKSFAWEHEFKAFVELASKDQFGLKIKLPNGNVAGRVLPVRIHDLDNVDIKLCESVLGGVLRGIEFIYKEPGVNKSLTADDDEKINQNKTRYRNQINKVALAIKEIILGLKAEPLVFVKDPPRRGAPEEEPGRDEVHTEQEKHVKIRKSKVLSGVAILALFFIAAILAFPKIFRKNTLEILRSSGERISIAVMPFQNMTNDTTWNVWQDGIQDMLINFLSNSTEELKVKQIETISGLIKSKGLTSYTSITPAVASTISKKLDANCFISGSIKQAGSKIRLSAQLFDSNTEEIIKSFEIETPSKEEAIFPVVDSLKMAIRNFLVISQMVNEVSPDILEVATTDSPEAYRYFIYGQNAYNAIDYPTAVNWLSQAIKIDSNFTYAAILFSLALYKNADIAEAKSNCLKIYRKRDQMPILQKTYTNWEYALLFETPLEEIKYLRRLLEINDQSPINYYYLAQAYFKLHQFDIAIPYFEKVLGIYNKWDLKPLFESYSMLGDAYHKTAQFKKEKKLYKKAEKYYIPDLFNRRYAICYLTERDTAKAKQYIDKLISVAVRNNISDAEIAFNQALIYSEAGILNKAEEYYRQSLKMEPDDRISSFYFARFLIEKDLNVDEGMKLIEKMLELSPDNFAYLDSKGLGLYNQGKYQEAKDILQKSWDLRREKAVYNHEAFLHLEAAKKAVAGMK